MLREVYRSKPPVYETYQQYRDRGGRFILGVDAHKAKAPKVETNINPLGLACVSATKDPVPVGASTIYLLGRVGANYWPFTATGLWVFDGKTGRFIRRLPAGFGLVNDFLFWGPIFTSRAGVFYAHPPGAIGASSGSITKFIISSTAVIVVDANGNFPPGHVISPDKFEDMSGFGVCGIDDMAKYGGVLLNGTGVNLGVWVWTTGEFNYSFKFPEQIISICLADANQCYVLLENRTIVLFDYARGEVMGTAKVPPQINGADHYAQAALAWDPVYRRLLMTEHSPDNADGTSTVVVRGFQMVNVPIRLTRPIPLKVPRQGTIIPVLVQVVDELNQGVGAYQVEAIVTGSGSLVGIPVTDHRGDGLIQVAIVGSPYYSPWQPPTFPEVPDVGVPAIGKSCWVGWVEFTTELAYEPPGNSILNLAESLVMKNVEGGDIGTFIQKPTVEEIEEMVETTVGPAIVYLPQRTWPRYPNLRPGDWLCVQAFCKEYETIPSFEVNMRAIINAIPPTYQIAIVCQCSTDDPTNTNDLIGLVPVYARLAGDYTNVTMLLVFLDQGSPDGLEEHPEVKPYWEDLFSGVPSAPAALALAAPPLSPVTFNDPVPIGPVNVAAKVTITGPGVTETEGLIIVGTPGAPGGGTDFNTNLPETAPNMRYVLTQVYESQDWKLNEPNGNNGRGAFVDRAVRAIHDIDAKFGYLRFGSGRGEYKGHTTDTLGYKSADGITAEIIQIVETDGDGSVIWTWLSRDAAALSRWFYANVSGSGDTSTGTDSGSPGGAPTNPIIAMSIDAELIVRDVTVSWNYFSELASMASPPISIGTLDSWVNKAKVAQQLINGKWYQGWNRYWEDLMDINNPGFPNLADPSHGSLPALFRA